MSTDATDPKNAAGNTATETSGVTTSPNNKGKGKAVQEDVPEDEEEDEEEEDDDDEGEEEEDDDEMEAQIDVSAIRPRRTRGVRVDYTSEEALKKAGLKPGDEEDDEEMKDD
ncbi:hypothetical protein K474DRAFT_1708767 [Panus rudis PR-1116 ss-1]|nr:hypothetical protein K474DRAFT_1708767 [Panus rudis PR-1116 ss-1]